MDYFDYYGRRLKDKFSFQWIEMHLVGLFLLFTTQVWSHQSTLTSTGRELFWASPSIPISFKTNTADMSSSLISSIIQSSVSEWNGSSSAVLNLVGSSPNEIKFVSNFPYGSGVVGVTEVTYGTSGAISKAVISLNDDYYFHSQPGVYFSGQIYLGDVVTHELGHLFGLSHSEVLDSTMFYSSFSGQSTTAFDDKAGVRQKYDSTTYGKITGHVRGGNHVGVLGAHVQAISRRTGKVAGTFSDENGYFTLGGLDLIDTYYLYISPIKNPSSLPGYFANSQDEFCPAAYVGSFFSACGRENDGKPQGITLTENIPEIHVGEVSIHCDLKSDETYSLEKLKTTFTSVSIYDYLLDQKNEKSFVGWFRKSTSSAWSAYDNLTIDLTSYTVSGTKYLKIAMIAFPFGNQNEFEMIVSQNGAVVTTLTKTLSGVTDTFDIDLSTLIPLSLTQNNNNFEIKVRSKPNIYLDETFPITTLFTSSEHLPYLITASLWETTVLGIEPIMDTGVNLSDNGSCLDAPFTYPVAKARQVDDGQSNSSQAAAGAACGTISPPNDGPPSGGSLGLIAIGFLAAIILSSLIKIPKKFLS